MSLDCAAVCFRKRNRTARDVDITHNERMVLWIAITRYQHWQSDSWPALLEVQYKQHYCRQWHDQPHAANRGRMNRNEKSGWVFRFCGIWYCVVCRVVSDILKGPFTCTFILRSNQSKNNIFFMDLQPFKMLGTILNKYCCTKLHSIMPQRTVILYSLVGCLVFRCSAWWWSCWTLPLCSSRACLFLMTSCWCRRCFAGSIHWTGLSFPASVSPWLIPATSTLFWICLPRFVVILITNIYT